MNQLTKSAPAGEFGLVKSRRLAVTILLFVALITLSPRQAAESGQAPVLAYSLSIPSLENERAQVSLLITLADRRSPLVIRSVPFYMDNPVAAADGPLVTSLTAKDPNAGVMLRTETSQDKSGETLVAIENPGPTTLIEYEVHLRLRESDQTRDYPIRIPYMNRKQALLYGNYLFCYPELGEDKQKSVSAPLKIDVDFKPPAGAAFWGITPRFSVRSIYQLMSLQFGVGDFAGEKAGTNESQLSVVYERIGDFTKGERKALKSIVPRAFSEVSELFGGAPFDHFSVLIFRDQALGGMEGTFACQVFGPRDLDVSNAAQVRVRNFYSVITHEIFHAWNPISLYPREDPWVKEGVTNYYGEVLSARAGLLEQDDLDNSFRYYERQLDENKLISRLVLTDPRLWENEYLNEDWRTVTYDRGKAVALLLDLEIRERSGNRQSLDDVMRFLYREYRDESYSHEDLAEAAEKATGVELSHFFRDYVAGNRLPSKKEIEAARKRIVELGVLSPAVAEPVG